MKHAFRIYLQALTLCLLALIATTSSRSAYASGADMSICGRVYFDTNCNGEINDGEPTLIGVTIILTDANGNVASVQTGNVGDFYCFAELHPGTYTVRVEVPADHVATNAIPSQGGRKVDNQTIVVEATVPGTTYSPNDFLICKRSVPEPVSLCGRVYIDTNRNGWIDDGGLVKEGVTITLLHGDGSPAGKSTVTDAVGKYCFANLVPGTYVVKEEVPPGFVASNAVPGAGSGGVKVDDTTIHVTATTPGTSYENNDFLIKEALPGLSLMKSANKGFVRPWEPVTYTYTVTNNGDVTLTDITVTDDNGTPHFQGDDFVVGTISVLAPGATRTFSPALYPPVTLCAPDNTGAIRETGMVIAQVLNGGNMGAIFIQSRDVNDNTYGVNAIGWGKKGHRFKDLVGSDQAEFSFTNGAGREVLRFKQDYISASTKYASGYGTLGVTGGDGSMKIGSAASILFVSTSLTENLNKEPFLSNRAWYTVDSPALSDPNSLFWEYRMIYTVVVSGTAFGPSGFGGLAIVDQHNSPAKKPFDSVLPKPCDSVVTNIATASATASGDRNVKATATATVRITTK